MSTTLNLNIDGLTPDQVKLIVEVWSEQKSDGDTIGRRSRRSKKDDEDEKPKSGRRSRRAKKDDEDDKPKRDRGRPKKEDDGKRSRSRRAKGNGEDKGGRRRDGLTDEDMIKLASEAAEDLGPKWVSELLDEDFDVNSVGDLSQKERKEFKKIVEKEMDAD